MANVKGPEELALLSRQRTTDAAHGLFDATQFKKLVDENVPEKTIKRFQEKYQDDLAGGKEVSRDVLQATKVQVCGH
jgi:hypothetical protein